MTDQSLKIMLSLTFWAMDIIKTYAQNQSKMVRATPARRQTRVQLNSEESWFFSNKRISQLSIDYVHTDDVCSKNSDTFMYK